MEYVAMHDPCCFAALLTPYDSYHSYVFNILYIVAHIYTNKNLQYAAAASRMVCKSAHLGPGSHKNIGPKRPIDRSKEAYRVYGKVLYTEA